MDGRQSLDAINKPVWAAAVDHFRWDGWSDAGERAATERIAALTKDQPILDIGVGGGRTVPLLRSISTDYTAIDYTPEMVEECRRRFPEANVLVADARDLHAFADETFALVSFSLNGIDAVDHDGRARVLSEAFRVLKPGGAFQYSTHNSLGPGPKQRPWTLRPIDFRSPRNTARRLKQRCLGLRAGLRNYRQNKTIADGGSDWCIRVGEAHDFGIVMHFSSTVGVRRETAEAGFSDVELYDDVRGRLLQPSDDTARVWYFNVLAFKPL